MTFAESIQICFSKFTTWQGRARRSEYWWFVLFNVVASLVAVVIDRAIGTVPILQILVSLALLLPGLAVSIRRLHDTNRSGWWIWIGLIPFVGAIILIIFYCQDSTPHDNNYGPNPKASTYA
jgi:uncharacterized membrane protein YhaH (DUF805 family)